MTGAGTAPACAAATTGSICRSAAAPLAATAPHLSLWVRALSLQVLRWSPEVQGPQLAQGAWEMLGPHLPPVRGPYAAQQRGTRLQQGRRRRWCRRWPSGCLRATAEKGSGLGPKGSLTPVWAGGAASCRHDKEGGTGDKLPRLAAARPHTQLSGGAAAVVSRCMDVK